MIRLHVVCALKDNYVYLVEDVGNRRALVVDPGEAAPVERALLRLGLELDTIWCTHHHFDHVGGIQGLLARWPDAAVCGSPYDDENRRIPGQSVAYADGAELRFAGLRGHCLLIPGHTLGHIAYVLGGHLFPGDTLFGSGCGRLFEGTPAQMQASLARLRDLPPDTRVWCGHEYTLANLRFAVTIDPDNQRLRARHQAAEADPGASTIPLSLAEEAATSPFLRWDAPALCAWAGADDPVAVFAAVRSARNGWQGPSPTLERRGLTLPW